MRGLQMPRRIEMQIVEDATIADGKLAARRWTEMWNRALPARSIVAEDCRVHFGRKPATERRTRTAGPDELQDVIDAIAWEFPAIRYSYESEPYVTGTADGSVITLLWNVEAPGLGTKSGIDILRLRRGLIVAAWSITGDLALPPMR
jgi:hypothetical protein